MERVAITGMGVVSPVGHDTISFADHLFAGRHGIVPIDRFDAADMSAQVYAPVRGLDLTQHFAAKDMRRLDRYSQLGLVAVREALAQSHIRQAVDPYRFGVFMSSGIGGVETLLEAERDLQTSGPRRVSPVMIPKWIPNMLAGLVAIEAGARAGSVCHAAACASSAVSIGEAVRCIRHGYADAVLCGGSEAIALKVVMAGFQNIRALTQATDPDRASLPFDRNRGGFVLGEGAAALVLESESHARARSAEILAWVSGYGHTVDGFHMTAPAEDGRAVERALRDALAEAGPSAGGLHVNAHGTGTRLNDKIEADVISRVLGPGTTVTSTKSMTGHLLGATGAAEVIAAVLALQRQLVPPTVGTTDLDDDIDIDVVLGSARPVDMTRAVSLSLGFGGHDVALVVDRPAP